MSFAAPDPPKANIDFHMSVVLFIRIFIKKIIFAKILYFPHQFVHVSMETVSKISRPRSPGKGGASRPGSFFFKRLQKTVLGMAVFKSL